MRFSVYIVCPSVLSCGSHNLHETLEAKNTLKQEKIMLQLTVNTHLVPIYTPGGLETFGQVVRKPLNINPGLNVN